MKKKTNRSGWKITSRARVGIMLNELFFLKDLRRRLSGELETIESRIRIVENEIAAETEK